MKGEDISSHSVSDNAPTPPKSINQEKIVNAENMENKGKKGKDREIDFSKALEQ